MTERKPKRPRDTNQLARLVVEIAVGDRKDGAPVLTEAQQFARKGGVKGGRARADALSPERRREIARRAAKARWGKS